MVAERTVTVGHHSGLHARPARHVVETATEYRATVTVTPTTGNRSANAASILELTALGVEPGDEVEVRADGSDERDALDAVAEAVAGAEDDR